MDKKILIILLIASIIFLLIAILVNMQREKATGVKEMKVVPTPSQSPETQQTPSEEKIIEVPVPVKVEETK